MRANTDKCFFFPLVADYPTSFPGLSAWLAGSRDLISLSLFLSLPPSPSFSSPLGLIYGLSGLIAPSWSLLGATFHPCHYYFFYRNTRLTNKPTHPPAFFNLRLPSSFLNPFSFSKRKKKKTNVTTASKPVVVSSPS